jgi:hypothetical protein
MNTITLDTSTDPHFYKEGDLERLQENFSIAIFLMMKKPRSRLSVLSNEGQDGFIILLDVNPEDSLFKKSGEPQTQFVLKISVVFNPPPGQQYEFNRRIPEYMRPKFAYTMDVLSSASNTQDMVWKDSMLFGLTPLCPQVLSCFFLEADNAQYFLNILREKGNDDIVRYLTRVLNREDITGLCVLAMDFIPDMRMDKYISSRQEPGMPFSTPIEILAAELASQLLLALKYKVIHSDLNPANVLINPTDNSIKFIDFMETLYLKPPGNFVAEKYFMPRMIAQLQERFNTFEVELEQLKGPYFADRVNNRERCWVKVQEIVELIDRLGISVIQAINYFGDSRNSCILQILSRPLIVKREIFCMAFEIYCNSVQIEDPAENQALIDRLVHEGQLIQNGNALLITSNLTAIEVEIEEKEETGDYKKSKSAGGTRKKTRRKRNFRKNKRKQKTFRHKRTKK